MSDKQLTADEILQRIYVQTVVWSMLYQNGDYTHVLLDLRSWRILEHNYNKHAPGLIDLLKKTVYGLPIIEVYQPYPFIALSKVVQSE